MPEFNPSPGDEITIADVTYRVSAHPAVPTFAFGQEGRKAFVYQLAHTKRRKLYALKKFKEAFRFSELSEICVALGQFADLPGMGASRRECLVGPEYEDTLAEYPDLQYAVLMPWMHGSTWYDLVVGEIPLDEESSLQMAWRTSQVLAALEENGVAHCDIAGPNVIIDMDAGEVHLVDVEDMYAPGMPPPKAVPAGTDGYNHVTAQDGLWYASADRFAGAVILAEMIGWHSPTVRDQSDEEHYFPIQEMQQDGDAYRLLTNTLYDISPALADLFEQAWFSPTLDDCPPLAEWERVLDPLARPSPVTEWVQLTAVPAPAAPHPGNWEEPQVQAAQPPPSPAPSSMPARMDEAASNPAPAMEPELPELPPMTQPPLAPSLPDTEGPLVGFRPLDMSAVPKQEAPTTGQGAPIEAPPIPESTSQPARPIGSPSVEPDGDLAGNGEAEEADETPEVASSVEKSESAQEIEEDPQAPEIVPAEAVPDEQDDVQDEGISEGAGGFALPRLQLPRFLRRQTQTDEGVSSLTGDVSDSPDEALPDLEEEEIDGEEVSTLLIAPPEPPQLGLREHSGDSGYVLHWEGVPEAAYYVLQESTRMAFSDGRQATVKSNEWHVNQRPPGTYYYRVRAHTEDDHTEWSNIVYKQIQAGKA